MRFYFVWLKDGSPNNWHFFKNEKKAKRLSPSNGEEQREKQLMFTFLWFFAKIIFRTKLKGLYKIWVRPKITSTFFYFDHFHIFDLFCTSTHRLYFDQNCTSRPIRIRDLTKGTKVEVDRSKYRKGRLMRT